MITWSGEIIECIPTRHRREIGINLISLRSVEKTGSAEKEVFSTALFSFNKD